MNVVFSIIITLKLNTCPTFSRVAEGLFYENIERNQTVWSPSSPLTAHALS